MNILTKVGQQDNIVTYEHVCDTKADMANIERRYITLGTVCIVLTGESEGLEVYMADSNKEWHDLVAGVSGSGAGAGGGLEIHLCAQNEVNENGLPDIEYPLDTVLYLVPSGEDSGNLYNEYIYVNGEWEPFGGTNLSANIPVEAGTGLGAVQTKAITVGNNTYIQQATGRGAFAEGADTIASGTNSHAEGHINIATGFSSHVEGGANKVYGDYSHAEGSSTVTNNTSAHSEGMSTMAYGIASHAEGRGSGGNVIYLTGSNNSTTYTYTIADGINWTPIVDIIIIAKQNNKAALVTNVNTSNNTITVSSTLGELENTQVDFMFGGAIGQSSHVEGYGTSADSDDQHAQGKYNIKDKTNTYADIVGNGSSFSSRSNAYALTWTGDGHYAGDVYVHANADSSGGNKLATEAYVTQQIAGLQAQITALQNAALEIDTGA